MNLPNKLTVLRLFLAFIFIVLLLLPGLLTKTLALLTFIAASLTDYMDGYLAKKHNQITDFGKLMDPIADKVLVLSAFLAFVQMQLVPAWMVVIIIFRELAITGLRALALANGKVVEADLGGKHKTACQALSIFIILIFIIFKEVAPTASSGRTGDLYKNAIFFLMLITVTLTLMSGLSYLVKNRGVYANAKKS
ncbi:MAG: CDP-diacylglycerol--glycerol-3-phosphate 3-phosphatidyltransferase [Candidatus Omnitrophica bacterium]|nr:CDP-diacylglycerol--glycerol-3-phosphate 3-phosphatidyltransferase [Candidatus Omnitrophota bacterium]MCM8790842.1 CDP-diacylglycerol--glycerol-3-phosphate 3-phosphatidyltransferase [Candidatus Omnitrophota bacterium]